MLLSMKFDGHRIHVAGRDRFVLEGRPRCRRREPARRYPLPLAGAPTSACTGSQNRCGDASRDLERNRGSGAHDAGTFRPAPVRASQPISHPRPRQLPSPRQHVVPGKRIPVRNLILQMRTRDHLQGSVSLVAFRQRNPGRNDIRPRQAPIGGVPGATIRMRDPPLP